MGLTSERDRQFLGLLEQSTTHRGLQPQRCIVSWLGGRKSKVKVWAKLVPSEGCQGESVPDFCPWLINGHLLPVPSHCPLSLGVFVSTVPLSSEGLQSYSVRAILTTAI